MSNLKKPTLDTIANDKILGQFLHPKETHKYDGRHNYDSLKNGKQDIVWDKLLKASKVYIYAYYNDNPAISISTESLEGDQTQMNIPFNLFNFENDEPNLSDALCRFIDLFNIKGAIVQRVGKHENLDNVRLYDSVSLKKKISGKRLDIKSPYVSIVFFENYIDIKHIEIESNLIHESYIANAEMYASFASLKQMNDIFFLTFSGENGMSCLEDIWKNFCILPMDEIDIMAATTFVDNPNILIGNANEKEGIVFKGRHVKDTTSIVEEQSDGAWIMVFFKDTLFEQLSGAVNEIEAKIKLMVSDTSFVGIDLSSIWNIFRKHLGIRETLCMKENGKISVK